MTAPTFAADVETMAEQLQQLTEQRNALQVSLDSALNNLTDTRADVERFRNLLAARAQEHRDDVALIGSQLIESVVDTGDEGIYDTLVDNVNYRLNVALPLRRRRYGVKINVEVTLGVEADSEDDARDEAASDMSRIESTIDNYSTDTAYSVVSSVESRYDWTVEEEDE